MKKIFVLFFSLLLLSGVTNAEDKKFGKGVTLKESTKISDILENPVDFLGKTVMVEGEVADVCQKAGCWLEVTDASAKKIRVKVKDGEIVFPKKSKGRKIKAEGMVYELKLSKEDAIEFYEHVAEEQGTKFDPSTITGPVTLYQIKGLGAVIDLPKDKKQEATK